MLQQTGAQIPVGQLITGLLLLIAGAILRPLFNDIYEGTKSKLLSKYSNQSLSDEMLKNRTQSTHDEISRFLGERRNSEPRNPRPDTWDEDVNRSTNHSQETMSLYHEKFGAEVSELRTEYRKRDMESEKLDRYYENPTNPIGIRMVAQGLAELASDL